MTAAERPDGPAIEAWENEGGALHCRPPRYRCGRRGTWSRGWLIYEVSTGIPPGIAALCLRVPDAARLQRHMAG